MFAKKNPLFYHSVKDKTKRQIMQDFLNIKIIYWELKVMNTASFVCSKFNIERIVFPFLPANTYM